MKRNRSQIVPLLVALYLVTRLAVLLFLDYRPRVFTEEFAAGVIARELIKGPFLPLTFLVTADYGGGIVVTGVLTVPFFLLLGENSFALRLVHILFSLGILMLLYAAARSRNSPRPPCDQARMILDLPSADVAVPPANKVLPSADQETTGSPASFRMPRTSGAAIKSSESAESRLTAGAS